MTDLKGGVCESSGRRSGGISDSNTAHLPSHVVMAATTDVDPWTTCYFQRSTEAASCADRISPTYPPSSRAVRASGMCLSSQRSFARTLHAYMCGIEDFVKLEWKPNLYRHTLVGDAIGAPGRTLVSSCYCGKRGGATG